MSRPRTEVTLNTQRSIVAKYKKGGPTGGLVALAKAFNMSISVIRRVLVENEIEIRGRGRPATVA